MTSKFILNKTFISAARIQNQNAGNSEGIATTTTSLQKGRNKRIKYENVNMVNSLTYYQDG